MLYIVIVHDEEETYEYEYGNLKHARFHFDGEPHAELIEYDGNEYHLMFVK